MPNQSGTPGYVISWLDFSEKLLATAADFVSLLYFIGYVVLLCVLFFVGFDSERPIFSYI